MESLDVLSERMWLLGGMSWTMPLYPTCALLFSLDQKKAFDRVDWDFMRATLLKMGLTLPFFLSLFYREHSCLLERPLSII